jgi:hypothetical protein
MKQLDQEIIALGKKSPLTPVDRMQLNQLMQAATKIRAHAFT